MDAPVKPEIVIAAAILIDPEERTLLVRKRGTSAFMQPGGKIDPGEAPLEALRRELREEIAVELDEEPVSLGVFSAEAANEAGSRVVAHLFGARLEAAVRPAAEIEEAVWVAVDEALANMPLAPLTRFHCLPAVGTVAELTGHGRR
ncbi:NUDIX domain-containing protein [Aquamicrobium sp. LC103]|uniref:NUDIX hydrolase n=1 Tax=Aquamicrobium sp. LC103 TaxID=1120658 RepID=UPI00063E9394|nr:NUDIX domain-containing protein [Aquamicrobium sp. LC103]TKT80211.1 NUDIX domain-containing protein [Aquamicrobium sp. LC103]